MTITTKLPRGRLFQGADTNLVFTVEQDVGPSPETWDLEFVLRNVSLTCPGREDPGDGTVRLSKVTADMTVSGSEVTVPILRADTIDLPADDYYAALWRTDDGNDRPLCIIRYLHLSGAARQSS